MIPIETSVCVARFALALFFIFFSVQCSTTVEQCAANGLLCHPCEYCKSCDSLLGFRRLTSEVRFALILTYGTSRYSIII
jgi:hypothetical protein